MRQLRPYASLRTTLAFLAISACALLGSAQPVHAQADEVVAIKQLVRDFLANTEKAEAHDRIWADELVYTSSSGERSGKPERMAAFAAGTQPASLATNVYRGEDMEVQLYGNTAVLTFRLVAEPRDGSARREYFNTGTFVKRNGEWRAVAWQATVIPAR